MKYGCFKFRPCWILENWPLTNIPPLATSGSGGQGEGSHMQMWTEESTESIPHVLALTVVLTVHSHLQT